VEPLPTTGGIIGIDWGVKETATTTSNAHDLRHAEHGKKADKRLAHYQRMMARRRVPKGKAQSKSYRKAQRQAAKLHKKVAQQRQDTGRKWAKSVVRDHCLRSADSRLPATWGQVLRATRRSVRGRRRTRQG
jgi:putative transposase